MSNEPGTLILAQYVFNDFQYHESCAILTSTSCSSTFTWRMAWAWQIICLDLSWIAAPSDCSWPGWSSSTPSCWVWTWTATRLCWKNRLGRWDYPRGISGIISGSLGILIPTTIWGIVLKQPLDTWEIPTTMTWWWKDILYTYYKNISLYIILCYIIYYIILYYITLCFIILNYIILLYIIWYHIISYYTLF